MSGPLYSYKENFEESEKSRYRLFVSELGNHAIFEDDAWICDKRIRSGAEPKNYHHIYFAGVPETYREAVKYYAVLRILQGDVIRTVRSRITKLSLFFKFYNQIQQGNSLQVNTLTAVHFKEYLEQGGYAVKTKNSTWQEVSTFLNMMNGFCGTGGRNPFSINPYSGTVKLDYKYIPDDVVDRLDRTFKSEDIELHLKCIFWLLRLVPSHISEILGMKIDCIKPYNGHYVIFIPTWKQNGGHIEPMYRSIHLEREGMGGYLLELLQKQQGAASIMQSRLPDLKKGYLFAYQRVLHYQRGGNSRNGVVNVMQIGTVSYQFKRICEQYQIKDQEGGIYNLTSHQFRHNGITDRLAAGFTLEQIADMTGHHGNAMIWNSYAHLDLKPETIVEKQKYVLKESEKPEAGYILFGGRILNMEEALEKRLLKNIRAQKVPGGICGDITGCKSDMWNCLECDRFVVDSGQASYFEEEAKRWEEKAERFSAMPMVRDNAKKHAMQYRKMVERIKMEDRNERDT